MAYNNGFPVSYQQYYPQYQQPMYQNPQHQVQQAVVPQTPNNGIIWIQGEGAARSYLLSPNTSVVLFDSDEPMFYIKSTDQAGMPTLKKFRFEEVMDDDTPKAKEKTVEFATKEEVDELRKIVISIKNSNKAKKVNDSVQA